MIGRLYGLTRRLARTRAGELVDQFELTDTAGRLVRTYPGGMRRPGAVAGPLAHWSATHAAAQTAKLIAVAIAVTGNLTDDQRGNRHATST